MEQSNEHIDMPAFNTDMLLNSSNNELNVHGAT